MPLGLFKREKRFFSLGDLFKGEFLAEGGKGGRQLVYINKETLPWR